jgi:hypothetical protein
MRRKTELKHLADLQKIVSFTGDTMTVTGVLLGDMDMRCVGMID